MCQLRMPAKNLDVHSLPLIILLTIRLLPTVILVQTGARNTHDYTLYRSYAQLCRTCIPITNARRDSPMLTT
jgi:hypothetical protein